MWQLAAFLISALAPPGLPRVAENSRPRDAGSLPALMMDRAGQPTGDSTRRCGFHFPSIASLGLSKDFQRHTQEIGTPVA